MRALSKSFLADLKSRGVLHPILERVRSDHTLMLAVRDGYVNIYYRGGNILEITEQQNHAYLAKFNADYNKSGKAMPTLPRIIQAATDAQAWVDGFAPLKEVMDLFFAKHEKLEREYQQTVVRENNLTNETEYFISDIEFADPDLDARFDLLGIRWLASQRTKGNACKAVLMEMKYGDSALGGSAGIHKHLRDIDALITNRAKFQSLLTTMESQFNQLDELGLLRFNHSKKGLKVRLSAEEKPEVVFILANHNPRSTKLRTLLEDPNITAYARSPHFDLRFFVSSFAGYGLHASCMVTLAEFKKLLKHSP